MAVRFRDAIVVVVLPRADDESSRQRRSLVSWYGLWTMGVITDFVIFEGVKTVERVSVYCYYPYGMCGLFLSLCSRDVAGCWPLFEVILCPVNQAGWS